MSPRIYSYDEMKEIAADERQRQPPKVISRPPLLISRRALLRGGTAAAMYFAFLRSQQAKAASFATYMGYISVKDPTFGATGNGSTDDAAAIQAAFNFAYGSPSSPHGNSGRFSNLGVFFPAGNYRCTAVLYLVGVVGGRIFGLDPDSTTISFESPGTGNTIVANGITPCIMTNGVSYTEFSGMTIGSNSSTSTAGIYIYQDGTKGITTAPVFRNMLIQGFTDGILAGFDASANCENGQLFNVQLNNNTLAGLRVVLQNTLNWQVYGGGASSCASTSTGVTGNSGAAYSCVGGGLSPIVGVSVSGNGYDFINNGFGGTTILGGSSESAACLALAGTNAVISDLAWRPTNSSGSVFADISNSGFLQLIHAFLNPGNNNGAGTLVSLGNVGKAILDGVEAPSGAGACVISGSAGSKLYLRGCTFSNGSVISGYTGTVAQNI